jgi:hypothetical protein
MNPLLQNHMLNMKTLLQISYRARIFFLKIDFWIVSIASKSIAKEEIVVSKSTAEYEYVSSKSLAEHESVASKYIAEDAFIA